MESKKLNVKFTKSKLQYDIVSLTNISDEQTKFVFNPFTGYKKYKKSIDFYKSDKLLKRIPLETPLFYDIIDEGKIIIRVGNETFEAINNDSTLNWIEDYKNIKKVFNNKLKRQRLKKNYNFLIYLLIIIIGLYTFDIIKKNIYKKTKYNEAIELLSEKKYDDAIYIFNRIKNYKDVNQQIQFCVEKIDSINIDNFNKNYSQINSLSYDEIEKTLKMYYDIPLSKTTEKLKTNYNNLLNIKKKKDKQKEKEYKKLKEKEELKWRRNNKKAYRYYKYCERKGVPVSKQDCEKVANNQIWIGMNIWLLVAKRGNPNDINSSNYGNGVRKQYCWYDWDPAYFYDDNDDNLVDSYN